MNKQGRIDEYKKDEFWAKMHKEFPSMVENMTDQYIYCPYCGEEMSNDDGQYPVSYWGEDEDKEVDCESCDKTFFIKEHVTRDYEVLKKEEEHDNKD